MHNQTHAAHHGARSSDLISPASPSAGHIRQAVSWGLYPLLIAGAVLAWALSKSFGWPLSKALLVYAIARFALLLSCEFLFPARREWGMSWASFLRDLKFGVVNAATMKLFRLGVVALAIDASQYNFGLLHGAPILVEVPVVLLTYEFFQYWVHRLSHSGQGSVGRFLWRVHAAHHLPTGVYLLMHPVGHPLNLALVMMVSVPLVVLGASSDALYFFGALMGLQGLISHLNVDVRVGPLNYLLTGTELHRYHHSADLTESKNYGAITPFWDIVFGTFVYKSGMLPDRIGVTEPEKYPLSGDVLKVLSLPFVVDGDAQPARIKSAEPPAA